MQQAETAEVHIPDVEESTIRTLLSYMYGGLRVMPQGTRAVLDLFKAADKYDVPGLVSECMHVLHRIAQAGDVAALLQVRCPPSL